MALYPAAVKKLIPPGPTDPRIKPRLAILHVDAGNAASLHAYFNGGSGGVESHFHVRKDGVVEQYRDTEFEADANRAANPFAISIETQGLAEGEWPPEQMASIKDLLLWLHRTHGIPLHKADAWNGSGVGYHILFMSEWAGGPRACPGPDRIKQFHNDLVPWMHTGSASAQEDDMPTPDQLWDHPLGKSPADGKTPVDAGYSLEIARNYAFRAWQESRASLLAVNALAKALGPEVEKAVAAALAGSVELNITVTPKE